uniref:C-type lectin domain-containing protein n=1 Tax=Glossina pallidipes TaxID=7398 RepID=A0A1B0A0I7_GLOPL
MMSYCLHNFVCFVAICVNALNFALCNNFTDISGDGRISSGNGSLHSSKLWSQFLEDYILSQPSNRRYSKHLYHMANGDGPPSIQSTYKRLPFATIAKRTGQASMELESHERSPLKAVKPQFRPMTYQMVQNGHQSAFLEQLTVDQTTQRVRPPGPVRIQQHPGIQTIRTVSENDLYLLGAIEKLVYRVDYLESRIRRTEQMIYYLMSGSNQKEVRDPCPNNFTRITDNCYYINSYQRVNWKNANTACKALNSHLAEFEKPSENEDVMAYLVNQPQHRGRDYWLGGLNPGLLWIWSNSAKPVNPHTNLTSIALAHHDSAAIGNDTAANNIDNDEKIVDKPNNTVTTTNEDVGNNDDVKGHGRCLRLTYNSAKHAYYYYGNECTSRHNYICEYEDKTLDNKIKKIARELNLPL